MGVKTARCAQPALKGQVSEPAVRVLGQPALQGEGERGWRLVALRRAGPQAQEKVEREAKHVRFTGRSVACKHRSV